MASRKCKMFIFLLRGVFPRSQFKYNAAALVSAAAQSYMLPWKLQNNSSHCEYTAATCVSAIAALNLEICKIIVFQHYQIKAQIECENCDKYIHSQTEKKNETYYLINNSIIFASLLIVVNLL